MIINILQTERIFLRSLSSDDVSDEYASWLKDSEVNKFLESRFTQYDYSDLVHYVKAKAASQNSALLGIFLRDDSKHIGNIQIDKINPFHLTATIGLMIGDKSHWGKGFAAEAIKLVADYVFQNLSIQKINAGCYENNIGSMKAFSKAGFEVEGILKKQVVFEDKRKDVVLLGLRAFDEK